MSTRANDVPQEPEHNQLEWPKVRKRMALGQTTESDWENASATQRWCLHQIELTIKSINTDDLSELEEDY